MTLTLIPVTLSPVVVLRGTLPDLGSGYGYGDGYGSGYGYGSYGYGSGYGEDIVT